MIATKNVRIGYSEAVTRGELQDLLIAGDRHWNPRISGLFYYGRQLAARAVSENAPNSLVVSSLLLKSCQFVASGTISEEAWTGDSLLASGAYDWLHCNLGEAVAETIRLQPTTKRFLATVVPNYFRQLHIESQRRLFMDGGFMTHIERATFCGNRYHANAMTIARWADSPSDVFVDTPEMEFFFSFVDSVAFL
jgi:predicted HD phosphohydrolase